MIDLGTLGGDDSVASAINDLAGDQLRVVGYAQRPNGLSHAFLSDGTADSLVDLGTLPGYSSSHAHDINDSGMVVGRSGNTADPDTGVEEYRAFVSNGTPGTMIDLGTLGPKQATRRTKKARTPRFQVDFEILARPIDSLVEIVVTRAACR